MKRSFGTLCAVLAAALYALNAPLSKLLLGELSPTMLSALLYLGAGAGIALVRAVRRRAGSDREDPLVRADAPYVIGMIVLDIAAPILLMMGLSRTTAANASLLNNFEIVATSLLAMFLFREKISRRLWLGIALVTASSILLSLEDAAGALHFSVGSLFILLACAFWGLENNCTRSISDKDPLQIVVVKGFGSGLGALVIALFLHGRPGRLPVMLAALLLGFVAYGLSILCYIYAQRHLGAARTSAYYALAPFLGAGLSLLLFRTAPGRLFLPALLLMAAGTVFVTLDE